MESNQALASRLACCRCRGSCCCCCCSSSGRASWMSWGCRRLANVYWRWPARRRRGTTTTRQRGKRHKQAGRTRVTLARLLAWQGKDADELAAAGQGCGKPASQLRPLSSRLLLFNTERLNRSDCGELYLGSAVKGEARR